MTTRADDCANQPHLHVGLCQRAGYANGLADAAEVSESALAAVLAEHEHEYERRVSPSHACSCGEWDGAYDDDGGPDDGQNDNADAYRAHVAAAIRAALATQPAP